MRSSICSRQSKLQLWSASFSAVTYKLRHFIIGAAVSCLGCHEAAKKSINLCFAPSSLLATLSNNVLKTIGDPVNESDRVQTLMLP